MLRLATAAFAHLVDGQGLLAASRASMTLALAYLPR
jgi:hypothetical protein